MLSLPYQFLKMWPRLRWDRARLDAYQDQRLRELVYYAYNQVPFYRQLYDSHGVAPADISGRSDLHKLPRINKAIVKQAGQKMLPKGVSIDDVRIEHTSGSSGSPLGIFRQDASTLSISAVKLRSFLANGYSVFDRSVIWNYTPLPRPFYYKLGLLRQARIDRNWPVEMQAAFLVQQDPQTIYVNPSALLEVGRVLEGGSRALPSLKRIFLGSETLTPVIREQIFSRFGVAPLAVYGSKEVGFMGWECRRREGYHVNADCMIIEVLDEATGAPVPSGQAGNVTVTDFGNPLFPLIRYQMGDLATTASEACDCGCQFPLLDNIIGRSIHMIDLPSGARISGEIALEFALRYETGVERYQGTLRRDGLLDVGVALSERATFNRQRVVDELKKQCENIETKVTIVDHIPLQASGKHKVFIQTKA